MSKFREIIQARKKALIILLVLIVVGAAIWAFQVIARRGRAAMLEGLETATVERGPLISFLTAEGVVRSQQSAILDWEISGEVAHPVVRVGEQVVVGDVEKVQQLEQAEDHTEHYVEIERDAQQVPEDQIEYDHCNGYGVGKKASHAKLQFPDLEELAPVYTAIGSVAGHQRVQRSEKKEVPLEVQGVHFLVLHGP